MKYKIENLVLHTESKMLKWDVDIYIDGDKRPVLRLVGMRYMQSHGLLMGQAKVRGYFYDAYKILNQKLQDEIMEDIQSSTQWEAFQKLTGSTVSAA